VSIDSALWLAGTTGETVVIVLLLYRRIWRKFPIFLAYSFWTLIAGAVGYALFYLYGLSPAYTRAYVVNMVGDSALLFGVLVELGWSVLRPLRPSLSRRTPVIIGAFILALGAAVWPLTGITTVRGTPSNIASLMHMQQTFYVLRVLVFLALAGFSQLLSIGWRDRELQIATGLGFTSLVGLVVAVLHSYLAIRGLYHQLSEIVIAGYLGSLVYWILCFSQKEEERRDFRRGWLLDSRYRDRETAGGL
jgi:hypothetical protein